MLKFIKMRLVSVILSVLASVGLVSFLAYATSIGADVTTGALTTTGNVTLGDAVADSITANGYFTQVRIGTDSTFEDIGVVGADELGVEGAVEIDGLSSLDGGFISAASSTHSTGVFNVGSRSFGVGTSTPSQEVGIVGDLYVDTTLGVATSTAGQELAVSGDALLEAGAGATTTLVINSTGATAAGGNFGSCIQLKAVGGSSGGSVVGVTMVRMYATSVPTTISNAVGYKYNVGLVVEPGACQ